jgi:hypothetical protein
MRERAITIEFACTGFHVIFTQFSFVFTVITEAQHNLFRINGDDWSTWNFREGNITRQAHILEEKVEPYLFDFVDH